MAVSVKGDRTFEAGQSHLSWSPDGQQIAFARVPAPESGKLDLVSVWIVDVATKQVHSLNGVQSFQNNPSYSPDGRWISYWYQTCCGSVILSP